MKKKGKGNQFLSGFGNENIIQDVYTGDSQLKPHAILSENDNQYKIEIGIPYMRQEDIDVATSQDKVIVNGERKFPEAGREKSRVYQGIFKVPVDALINQMKVGFINGLVNIRLPKNKIIKQYESGYIR